MSATIVAVVEDTAGPAPAGNVMFAVLAIEPDVAETVALKTMVTEPLAGAVMFRMSSVVAVEKSVAPGGDAYHQEA